MPGDPDQLSCVIFVALPFAVSEMLWVPRLNPDALTEVSHGTTFASGHHAGQDHRQYAKEYSRNAWKGNPV